MIIWDQATIILFAIICGALMLVIGPMILWYQRKDRERKQRIERLLGLHQKISPADLSGPRIRRQTNSSGFSLIPTSKVLSRKIEQAGWTISPGGFVSLGLAVALVTAILIFLFLKMPFLPSLGLGVTIGLGGTRFLLMMAVSRRHKQFLQVFPDALDLLVRGLKSGLPITEGIQAVGRECAGGVGEIFGHIAELVRLGRTLEQALWESAEKIDLPEFNFFAVSLTVQQETGGNLGETLDNLSEVLRRRLQTRLKIRALSSEARASAYIIGSLPFVLLAILFAINSRYVMTLFIDPRGHIMVAVGGLTMLVGFFVIAKMIRFEI